MGVLNRIYREHFIDCMSIILYVRDSGVGKDIRI